MLAGDLSGGSGTAFLVGGVSSLRGLCSLCHRSRRSPEAHGSCL